MLGTLRNQLSLAVVSATRYIIETKLSAVTSQHSVKCNTLGQYQVNRQTHHHAENIVKVEARPRVCMHDVPTKLKASGLKPHTLVTLKLSCLDPNGIEFSSVAHYFTNKNGYVDVSNFKSWGGSYEGVFPAGLFTTLEPPPGKHSFKRFTAVDTAKHWQMAFSVHNGHLNKEQCSGEPLAEVKLERHLRGRGVRRVEVEDGRVRGALYIPAGPGPHPAVIDMFGAAVAIMEHRSAMLASRGIMSLALPYFGYKDLPQDLKIQDLDYFEEAVEFLLSTPEAIPDRCGVVATCQGGATGLAMGVWLDKVKAVFAINSATCLYDSVLLRHGKELLPKGFRPSSDCFIFDKLHRGRFKPEVIINGPFHIDSELTIPIEKASPDTEFYLTAGGDCSFLSPYCLDIYVKRMQRNGNGNFQTKIYPGAGHILEPPYGPFIYHSYQQYFPYKNPYHTIPAVGSYFHWGGSADANCKAQQDLWHDIQAFVRTEIEGKSEWYQNYLSNEHGVRK